MPAQAALKRADSCAAFPEVRKRVTYKDRHKTKQAIRQRRCQAGSLEHDKCPDCVRRTHTTHTHTHDIFVLRYEQPQPNRTTLARLCTKACINNKITYSGMPWTLQLVRTTTPLLCPSETKPKLVVATEMLQYPTRNEAERERQC